MMHVVKEQSQQLFNAWLNRRIPASSSITLNQRRIFIFPSKYGLAFSALLALILICAINYENNLVYLLFFLSVSLFNTAIIFTYQNVAGLSLNAIKANAAFAGDNVECLIEFAALNKAFYRLHVGWPDNPDQVFDLEKAEKKSIKVLCLSERRGLYKPGRLLIESYYPLGLIRCWSWVDLDLEALIYPKPIKPKALPAINLSGKGNKTSPESGSDDFYGFKTYSAGDSLKQVDWRGFAKAQGLNTKVYRAQQDDDFWLDWSSLTVPGVEERLSQLCGWALLLAKQQKPYGLRLPNLTIAVNSGEAHQHRVLSALALYNIDSPQRKEAYDV